MNKRQKEMLQELLDSKNNKIKHLQSVINKAIDITAANGVFRMRLLSYLFLVILHLCRKQFCVNTAVQHR